ncbi:MAG: GNAT family N-acetyltransferase [Oscillospiraceae bacterium]|nr:GNAT family N-acetyltransferase [Oscillospiraceae bacterium]
MKTVFETARIRFVEVSELLVNDYVNLVNDIEHVGRLIGRTKTVTEEKEREWVREKLEEKAVLFSMLEKDGGAFIGNIELMDVQNGTGELGIAITWKKQDLGYGTEAIPAMVEYGFSQCGLTRIFLKVYPDNGRAIHVYEKCGFREYDRTEEDVYLEIVPPRPDGE